MGSWVYNSGTGTETETETETGIGSISDNNKSAIFYF